MTADTAAARRSASRSVTRALLGAALAVPAFAATLVMVSHGGMFPRHPVTEPVHATAVMLAALSTAPLIWWDRFRLGAFAATATAGVAMAGLGYPVDLLFGPAAALYLVAAHREAPWTRSAGVLVAGMFAVYLLAAWAADAAFPTSGLFHTGLAWAVAWFAGERTRLMRQHIDDLRQRADRAERESERERLLAIAEERSRIARDLHDSAGHAISLIAVRAGAARLRDDPEHSKSTLEAVESLARRTAAEIDQLVSTLREERGVEAPVGLGSLDALIAAHAESGLVVRLAVTGEPRPLGTVSDQAAYRILQEALANAERHGTGTARLDLAWRESDVEFTVANPVRGGARPRPGGGHGLIGMRERAGLLGGEIEAAADGGEFRVRARIPYGGQRP